MMVSSASSNYSHESSPPARSSCHSVRPAISLVVNQQSHRRIGLSHRYNLYFVACEATVKVYTTQFPEYTFRPLPEIIIYPQCHELQPGYSTAFSSRPAHAINSLLVDKLGFQEVLLIAREDGDLIGYYTKDINAAVASAQSRRRRGSPPSSHNKLFAFIHRNVGASAWGLSVHTRARAIAVSANNLCVTVFYPALLNTSASSRVPAEVGSIQSREVNFAVVIGDLGNNIPSVSFCNTDDDPLGRWLVAGTIDGIVFWIDLEKATIFKAVRACYCKGAFTRSPQFCQCGHEGSLEHAIWGVRFLDKRIFRHVAQNDMSAAVNCLNLPDGKTELPSEFWDISNPFEANDALYNYVGRSVRDQNPRSGSAGRIYPVAAFSGGDYLIRRNILPSSSFLFRQRGYQPESGMDQHTVAELLLHPGSFGRGTEWDLVRASVDYSSRMTRISRLLHGLDESPEIFHPRRSIRGLQGLFGVRNLTDSCNFSSYIPTSRGTSPTVDVFPTTNIEKNQTLPDAPLVSVSVSDVLLFQPHDPNGNIKWDNEGAYSHQSNHFPLVGIHKPLHIATDPGSHSLVMLHNALIPPLGVLVVGSNRGRIGIFTLTKVVITSDEASLNSHSLETHHFLCRTAGTQAGSKTVYACRFDYFLPPPCREGMEQYPTSDMCGIAVGPVPRQGFASNDVDEDFAGAHELEVPNRPTDSNWPAHKNDVLPFLAARQSDSPPYSIACDGNSAEVDEEMADLGVDRTGSDFDMADVVTGDESLETMAARKKKLADSPLLGAQELSPPSEGGVSEGWPAHAETEDFDCPSRITSRHELEDGSSMRPWRIVVTHLDQTYTIYHIWRGDDGLVHSLIM